MNFIRRQCGKSRIHRDLLHTREEWRRLIATNTTERILARVAPGIGRPIEAMDDKEFEEFKARWNTTFLVPASSAEITEEQREEGQ